MKRIICAIFCLCMMLEIFPFATSAASFRVSTLSAKDIGTTSATIIGRADTNGGYNYRGYGFMYRSESGNWKSVGWQNGHLNSGSTYSFSLCGLKQGTRYEVEFYAESPLGTSYGVVQTFTTAEKSSSTSSKSSSVSNKTAGSTASSSSKARKVLETPEITSPKKGTSELSDITFRWSGVSGATYYRFSVKDMTDGKYMYENVKTTSRSIKIPKSKIADGHKIKFAVGAYNSTLASDWDTVTLTVRDSVDLIINKDYDISVSNRGKEVIPHYENLSSARSSAAYNTVINQFKVDNNSRYKRTLSSTFCNIFAWDVMTAMDAVLPHWVNYKDEPADSKTTGATEMTANLTYLWLENHGAEYGWKPVTAKEAQKSANAGHPTIVIGYNSKGSGHIAVVRPETDTYKYSDETGPIIAQAGAYNFSYGYAFQIFKKNKLNPIRYYTAD